MEAGCRGGAVSVYVREHECTYVCALQSLQLPLRSGDFETH